MARGMSRLGCLVSSPRVDAASKPAKDRKPKTTPRKTVDSGVPEGRLNTDQATPSPCGALWPASLPNTIAITMTIKATVMASAASSSRVPPRAGVMAIHQTSSIPIAPSRNPDQVGGFFQTPSALRKLEANRPPANASAKASGTARPTVVAVPCGLMLAAIDGAISAREMPMASQTLRLRRSLPCPVSVSVSVVLAAMSQAPPAASRAPPAAFYADPGSMTRAPVVIDHAPWLVADDAPAPSAAQDLIYIFPT